MVCGLLVAVILSAKHRLQGVRASVVVAPGLWSTGSVVGARGLVLQHVGSSPDQGSHLCPLDV